MKLRMIVTLVLIGCFTGTLSYGEETLKGKRDRESYVLGLKIGSDLKQQSIEIKTDIFMKGVTDALSGGKRLLNDDEIREIMTAFAKDLTEKQAVTIKKLAEKNKQEGDLFLAENKKKEGVKTLPSGLQYKVINVGKGQNPKATDTVTVNYRGTFINGTEFDSSYRRGQPATFPVKGVIPGWTEALQLMKEGAKWQLFVPPTLAYGEKGAGGVLGPNTTLLFEVELISIKASGSK
jgi:FKBP-type peptidyl-prolyl cis-trans isomerase FklB